MKTDDALRAHLAGLFASENAHVNFDASVAGLPFALQGGKPDGAAHTPWQVLEHMCITQRDVLKRIGNANHRSLGFPDEYWPPAAAPQNEESWNTSVSSFRADQKALLEVIAKADLFGPTRPGADNVLIDDLLMLVDHNAYHLGELILLRRQMGAWT